MFRLISLSLSNRMPVNSQVWIYPAILFRSWTRVLIWYYGSARLRTDRRWIWINWILIEVVVCIRPLSTKNKASLWVRPLSQLPRALLVETSQPQHLLAIWPGCPQTYHQSSLKLSTRPLCTSVCRFKILDAVAATSETGVLAIRVLRRDNLDLTGAVKFSKGKLVSSATKRLRRIVTVAS